MTRTRRKLMRKLAEAEVEATVQARMKHLFSIHRKMERKGYDLDRLYDLMAFRIITKTEEACYEALSICHKAWKPLPNRVKDYIAHPKPNAYQSLHTTLISEEGLPFEVQIRTDVMHHLADDGLAAHFTYKEGSDEKMRALVRDLKESLEHLSSMEEVKKVLSPDEIYVLTPRGDLFSFPSGATILDFAYRIHTEVGHHTKGATMNDRIVPLGTRMNTGDCVSIQTHPKQHPSRDWLGMVRTPSARAKIRRFLYRKEREAALDKGRKSVEDYLAERGETVKHLAGRKGFESFLRSRGWSRLEDLFAAVGLGRVTPDHLFAEEKTATEDEVRTVPSVNEPDSSQLVIGGESGLDVRFARCCYPLPGEAVRAAVTQTKGIVLHRAQCPLLEGKRILSAHWSSEQRGRYPALLHLVVRDAPDIKAEISKACTSLDIAIAEIRINSLGQGQSHIAILIMVKNVDLYHTLTGSLKSHPGIVEVSRAGEPRGSVRL